MVGTRELPAGKYTISMAANDETTLSVLGPKGEAFAMAIETRLADLGQKGTQVVFDKAPDGTYFLSELHVSGRDGFAFKGASNKHSHVMINSNK